MNLSEHLAHQKAMQAAYDRVDDLRSRARLAERQRRDEIEHGDKDEAYRKD